MNFYHSHQSSHSANFNVRLKPATVAQRFLLNGVYSSFNFKERESQKEAQLAHFEETLSASTTPPFRATCSPLVQEQSKTTAGGTKRGRYRSPIRSSRAPIVFG